MKKMMMILVGVLVLSSAAQASNASSVGDLNAVVKKSAFIKTIQAHAKRTAGKNATCTVLRVTANPHDSTVVVNGSCNNNTPDAEFSVLFEIKGVVYDGSDALMIESVNFDYAG